MSLKRYVGRRALEGLLTLWVIMTLIFILFMVMPGDPTSMVLDPKMTPAVKEMMRELYGLNDSPSVQYARYLRNLITLDLGNSFFYSRPVLDIITEALPNTVILFTTSSVLSALLGISLGRVIAWRRNSKLEYSLTIGSLIVYNLPVFWVGLIFIFIFSYTLKLFPLGGMRDYMLWSFGATWGEKLVDILYHLALPLLTLTLVSFCGMMLLMRTSMVETIKEDYVYAATARGLPEKVVRNRYAARNAELPVVTSLMLSISASIGGGVLTETVFNWPGLGYELVHAVMNRDYPLAQGAFFMLSIITVVTVILIDIVYVYLDPRVSYD